MPLSTPDLAGLAIFLGSWMAYHLFVERQPVGGQALNNLMNEYRLRWMLEMQAREIRIVDSAIMNTLQSGTAFFASTSLLALGGALALLRGADDAMRVLADLPLGAPADRALWDVKVVGLAVIFGYAFFKFAWSYRLFNYVAILIGATPPATSGRAEQRKLTALRAAEMSIVAGRHFNRGQRAFFFALGYLGWFVNAYALIGATVLILILVLMRQFGSDARAAVTLTLPDFDPGAADLWPGKESPGASGQTVGEKADPFA